MTKDYYDKNYKEYIKKTINANMDDIYQLFEKHLSKGGKILDIGFGSGRDSLYFSKNYDVTSIDPSINFCNEAKKLGLKNILNIRAEDINLANEFDGIWASASLLHVEKDNLNTVLKKCYNALKDKGIMYCSFKYGTFNGLRDERYYLDLDEYSFPRFLKDVPFFGMYVKITQDKLDRDTKWLNVILYK